MIIQGVDNLFAYCFNSPIINIDSNGMWYYTILKPYKISLRTVKYTLNYIAYMNMKNNNDLFTSYVKSKCHKLQISFILSSLPIINCQSEKYIKDMRYGLAKVKNVGCEIIAIYNLLILIKKPQMFTNIINEFELNNMYYGGTAASGHLGTDPDDLYKYFKAHGIKYSKTNKFDNLKNQLSKNKSGKFIVGFWTRGRYTSTIHTVCVKKNSNSNYVTVYNYYSDTGTQILRVSDFLKRINDDGNFITSYKF